MDKYVWHLVKDELPPAYADRLILAVNHFSINGCERYMIFGYYSPAYGKNTWRDDSYDKLDNDHYIVTHWMFAPDMPED